jgi:hypothetical protein
MLSKYISPVCRCDGFRLAIYLADYLEEMILIEANRIPVCQLGVSTCPCPLKETTSGEVAEYTKATNVAGGRKLLRSSREGISIFLLDIW